jgi:hypothetical protein
MDVEKRDAITFAQVTAFDVFDGAANLAQVANADVTGDQRVGNSLQSALLQVNICPADFGEFNVEER